jgi:hypothetical protein
VQPRGGASGCDCSWTKFVSLEFSFNIYRVDIYIKSVLLMNIRTTAVAHDEGGRNFGANNGLGNLENRLL